MRYQLVRSNTLVPFWTTSSEAHVFCQKFINGIQRKGKKLLAEKTFYKMLYVLKRFLILQKDMVFEQDPLKVFSKAVQNAQPIVQLKSEKKSGRTIQIPSEIPPYRRLRLSIQWIKESADSPRLRGKGKFVSLKKKPSALAKKPFSERLALEILKAAFGKGKAIDKKNELHRRAFLQRAHLRYKFKSVKRKK
jgi:small subunit ribosomal protein S7